jgi:putative ABC transport system ATP-binding protein
MSDGAAPIVEIRGLRKVYLRERQEVVVLDGIDLDIPAGAFEALMGPSGSGKTTLLNLIAGIDQPTSGSLKSPPATSTARAPSRCCRCCGR